MLEMGSSSFGGKERRGVINSGTGCKASVRGEEGEMGGCIAVVAKVD